MFMDAGSGRFSVVNCIQASVQDASSKVNVSFLLSSGGGSVVLQESKAAKIKVTKTKKFFLLTIFTTLSVKFNKNLNQS